MTSEAKAAAARANARKGGRQPKFALGERVIGRDVAPADYRERVGTVVRHAGRAEYEVRFDARPNGQTDHVMSWWLDRL